MQPMPIGRGQGAGLDVIPQPPMMPPQSRPGGTIPLMMGPPAPIPGMPPPPPPFGRGIPMPDPSQMGFHPAPVRKILSYVLPLANSQTFADGPGAFRLRSGYTRGLRDSNSTQPGRYDGLSSSDGVPSSNAPAAASELQIPAIASTSPSSSPPSTIGGGAYAQDQISLGIFQPVNLESPSGNRRRGSTGDSSSGCRLHISGVVGLRAYNTRRVCTAA